MIVGAGILFLTKEGKTLYLKRGNGGDYPGYWCFPGGTLEDGETLEQCAKREAKEELGNYPSGKIELWTRRIKRRTELPVLAIEGQLPGEAGDEELIDFTTYLQRVEDEFAPEINGEHVGYAWGPVEQPPEPLHPGARVALNRFAMDELGIARAMADDELVSPQTYRNVTLFNLRITGTGAAYRVALDEFVWRDPSLYLNQEFLDRCAGLTVIMEHPGPQSKHILNDKEFKKRAIGSIMFAYIRNDEVWGIAKIYDAEAIKEMKDTQMSTSPAVVFRNPEENIAKVGGEDVLIEGKPTLLDHLAICGRGVWDKGGEPRGIALTKGDNVMTEEEKRAAEERARADAEAKKKEEDAKWDKLLGGLDKINARLDTQEARLDSMNARVDSACAKMDSDEDEKDKEKSKDDEDDEDEDDKAKAKKAAADSDKTKSDKTKSDEDDEKAKKDAEDEKAKKDADEEKEKEMKEKAKADSELDRRLKAVESQMKPMTDEERRSVISAQERADSVFQAFGNHAPIPLAGEDALGYRHRVAKRLQEHSQTWKGISLERAFADSQAFDRAETQIYAEAVEAARSPKDLAEYELREVPRTDSQTGHRITEFRGRHTFITQMKPPVGAAVTKFLTEPVDRRAS